MKNSGKTYGPLSSIIKQGLSAKDEVESESPRKHSKETLQELNTFADNCVSKAGIIELG